MSILFQAVTTSAQFDLSNVVSFAMGSGGAIGFCYLWLKRTLAEKDGLIAELREERKKREELMRETLDAIAPLQAIAEKAEHTPEQLEAICKSAIDEITKVIRDELRR